MKKRNPRYGKAKKKTTPEKSVSKKRSSTPKTSSKTNRRGEKKSKFKRSSLPNSSQKSQRSNVRRARKKGASYSTGKGQNRNQLTYWFPDIPESRKVANLRSWDAEPLQYYITKNHPVLRKGKKIMSVTGEPVTDIFAGYKAPQSVWVKLVKRRPRGRELFYSAELSPSDFVVNKRNTLAFSVGILEKYYADHTEKVKDKIKVQDLTNPYKRKDSDPDDYEGKPMKIVAVIYHFLY